MKHKLFAVLLAFTMLAGITLPVAAESARRPASDPDIIRIETVENFLTFAENCELDSWSQNKQVLLLTDISLEDTDFAPIPTFGGSFDGGGHTVSGLNLEQSITPCGLFGTIQATGEVKNLNVQGNVKPDGEALSVGGVAGENYGTIENCTFRGAVEGRINTGGIAGMNYGTLNSCSSRGSVIGDNRTGGIAGYNYGVIISCRSNTDVNTESVDPKIDPKDISLNFNIDFSKAANLDISDAASDTGGIAGYSGGTIKDCENTGNVGYPHIGYNLGGIAGRNCGLAENCINEGFVTGRKDVGGIVGQVEPDIQTIISPDYLKTLSNQFDNLGSLVNRAGSDGAAMGGDVQAGIENITAYQSKAHSALEALAKSASGREVNKKALSDLGKSIQGMANASGDLRNSIGQGVDTLTDDISAISNQINAISRTFALATDDAKKDKITDVSTVKVNNITEGMVRSCVNRASVEEGLNVRGICGIMSVESTVDPEDDAPGSSLTQRRRYELKAVVQDCENTGKITGKRSYIGGICGRMELGMISGCRGYGTITSDNGDYVGGIAGLAGGTVKDCFAKCTLSGGSYIGGIVGSGISEDYGGDYSTVSGCYSMVEIPEYEQYVGAIAGVKTGVFTKNYFVSDTLAGINRVSYFALAEPISYDELYNEKTLPTPLKEFTLSFLVDGETIKTVPFSYGASFDAAIFPKIPQKDGYYARWDISELTNLRFNTVVEATYYPYITALSSEKKRTDDKPMIFVQGQFKEEDGIVVTPSEVEFTADEEQQLLEQWHISIPADGLESHTVRYLPERENAEVYILRNGGWSKARTETMGSYLAFEITGAEADIAVTAGQSHIKEFLIAAAAVLLLVLTCIIALKKKVKNTDNKKIDMKKHWIIIVILIICGVTAACVYAIFPHTKTGRGIQAYDALSSYLEQPEQNMRLTVKAQIEDNDVGFTAQISRRCVGDKYVTAICEGARRLYYCDGVLFMEDGTAFRVDNVLPDYSALVESALGIYKNVDINAEDGVFTITAEDSQATEILKLLMPSAEALLPSANRLTVDLITDNGDFSQLQFTGAGNLTDSVKTPFSVSAVLGVLPVSENLTIPKAVEQAVSSGNYEVRELSSEDIVRLIDAWSQLKSKNPIAAEITLEATCGELTVSSKFDFYRWKVSDTVIQGVQKGGKTYYFTDNAICDESGRKVSISAIDSPDISKLLDIVISNISNTEFDCYQQDGANIYNFALNQQAMKQIVGTVFPVAEKTEISYDKGVTRLIVENGRLQSADITCGGSGKLLAAKINVQLSLEAVFQNDSAAPALPDAVAQALIK